eukprot:GHVT01088874.1.p1 GENE.GHVT01088874.1~~GHVT01088874.1.p1  ORF type:complete len:188 (+),score=57.13 GHVT01088874.1:1443-2006(+)
MARATPAAPSPFAATAAICVDGSHCTSAATDVYPHAVAPAALTLAPYAGDRLRTVSRLPATAVALLSPIAPAAAAATAAAAAAAATAAAAAAGATVAPPAVSVCALFCAGPHPSACRPLAKWRPPPCDSTHTGAIREERRSSQATRRRASRPRTAVARSGNRRTSQLNYFGGCFLKLTRQAAREQRG